MKIFLCAMVSFCCFFVFSADDKIGITDVDIKGAFGYNLGDDCSGVKLENGYVNVKIPFRNFTRCFLELTVDKKISRIFSKFSAKDVSEGQREFKIILNSLEKKYKCKFSDITNSYEGKNIIAFKVVNQKRAIFLFLTDNITISLFYYDYDLLQGNDQLLLELQRQRNNNLDAI